MAPQLPQLRLAPHHAGFYALNAPAGDSKRSWPGALYQERGNWFGKTLGQDSLLRHDLECPAYMQEGVLGYQ